MIEDKTFVRKADRFAGRGRPNPVRMLAVAVSMCFSIAHAYSIDNGAVETVNGDGSGSRFSPWNVGGVLNVGYSSSKTGELAIKVGGRVNNTTAYIGYNSGSSGTVTVEGSGSTWSNSSLLYVGYRGTGELTISDGGTVMSDLEGYLGFYAGSSGTVTVEGSASSWVHSGDLAVGYEGTGVLTINGGTVSNNVGYIGNTGSGTVTVNGAGSWVNSKELYVGYFNAGTGKLAISDGSSVSNTYAIIGNQAGSLGTVTVDGSGSSWVNTGYLYVGNSGTGELTISDNAVVHTADGVTVALNSTATGTLDVTSGSTLETLALKAGKGTVLVTFDDGTLRALADNSKFITGFAPGEIVIAAGGMIIDDNGYMIEVSDSRLSGSGLLTKIGSGTLTLSGVNTYSGGTSIEQGALTITNEKALGSGTVALYSVLNVNPFLAGPFTFNNALTESGIMNVNMVSTADVFSFGSSVGSAFTGTVVLNNSTFTLSGDNTTALTHAMLQLNGGNKTYVGAGAQNIGGLTMNGGNLVFAGAIPPGPATGMVSVGDLALNSGSVLVDLPAGMANPIPGGSNLLTHDDGMQVQLIAASGTVSGNAAQLTFKDSAGNVISAVQNIAITESGTTVANATYDYGLSSGTNTDGLYVDYLLTELDLVSGQTLHLAADAGASAAASTLSAKVTGSGNLDIDGSLTSVTLNNTNNDYTGTTTVSDGTLIVGADNALGKTSDLILSADTTVDVNRMTQDIGALNTAAGSVVNLNGGTLTINDTLRTAGGTNGGTVYGTLTGGGHLIIDSSIVTIDGANPGLSAAVTITGGSEAQLNDALGLGTGNVDLVGATDKLTFMTFNGSTASGTLSNALSGLGTVALTTTEDIVLSGDNSNFSGVFDIGTGAILTATLAEQLGTAQVVDNGVFRIDTATDWTLSNTVTGAGELVKSGSGTLTLNGVHTYTGATTVAAGTLKAGVANVFSAASAFTVASGGTLDLDAYDQTIAGLANNGAVQLSSTGSANPVGTILTVNGNYESNGGSLSIRTVLGDDTSVTDKLVADGVTTGSGGATSIYVTNAGGLGAQTINGIEVVHVMTGSSSDAFVLGRPVTAGAYEYTLNQGADQNWYLVNVGDYNPATGAYLSNQTAATTLFMHTLYDRQGHANNLKADGSPQTAWARVVTRHGTGESVGGSQETRTNSDVIHLGVDVGTWQVQDGNLHVGIMGAYGKSKTRATSKLTGTWAEGRLDGYSLGAYGTWFADEAEGRGLYADGWAQYSWFKNKISGSAQVRNEEKYDSRLWTVSAEAGYGFLIGKTANTEIMLTPQIQIAYNNYSADNYTDGNGLRVSGDEGSGVVTRVGARLYGRSTSVFTARPFVEVNWIYSDAKNELNFNGEVLRDDVPHNRLEAKLGIEGSIAKNWTLWGQAGVQWGKDNYHRYEGQFGIKYQW